MIAISLLVLAFAVVSVHGCDSYSSCEEIAIALSKPSFIYSGHTWNSVSKVGDTTMWNVTGPSGSSELVKTFVIGGEGYVQFVRKQTLEEFYRKKEVYGLADADLPADALSSIFARTSEVAFISYNYDTFRNVRLVLEGPSVTVRLASERFSALYKFPEATRVGAEQ